MGSWSEILQSLVLNSASLVCCLDQAKKMKVSILILCVALFAVNEAKSKPNKPSKADKIDAAATSEDVKECFDCIIRNAPICLQLCIPNPHNKDCFACLIENAPQCLRPCGFPLAQQEFFGLGTCKGHANDGTQTCTITENLCGENTPSAT